MSDGVVSVSPAHGWRRRAGVIADAFKLRIGSEITLAAAAGAALMPGPGIGWGRLTAVLAAVLLASAAAGAYNQYAERDIDARMQRTRQRPFVTGEFAGGRRWLLVLGALVASAALLAAAAANWMAAGFTLLGAFTYGVVYTVWLKRRTALNIVFGGFAGTFAVLAGAAAVDTHLSAEALIFSLALFFWTPPHFWSLALYNRQDYERAGVPMLPALIAPKATGRIVAAHVVVVVALSLAPALFDAGIWYTVPAAVGGAYFLHAALRLAQDPTRARAWTCFKASLVQLSLLLLGALADGIAAGRLSA